MSLHLGMSKQLKVPGANGFLAGPGVGSIIGGAVGEAVGEAVEDAEDVGVAEEDGVLVVVVETGCGCGSCGEVVCAFAPMRSMVAISATHVVGRSRILCIRVH